MGKEEHEPPHFLFQRIPTGVIGIVLLGFGWVGLSQPQWFAWLGGELTRALADALVIVGVLTIIVDPFLKGRLYRELATNTFQYLLGFAQPKEIQDALRKLAFETRVYAHDLRSDCTIECESESRVRLKIHSTVRIENPTGELAEHEPLLAFEEAECPSVEHILIRTRDETRPFPGNLQKNVEDRVCTHHTDRVFLRPGESMTVEYAYSVALPCDFFYKHYFGVRTIDVTLSITAPGFEVSSDLGGKGPIWQRKKLFMIGDHFTIRWRPVPRAEN